MRARAAHGKLQHPRELETHRCINFRGLNQERESAGLTRTTIISNAPPVLAFTTVALGGFRDIIANILWIRAAEMQEEGKYFEQVQLADWITKLQPHFSQVWVNQAWNMAYNISVKFPDHHDRWLWVQRGLELQPGGHALGLLARQTGFTRTVLDGVQRHFHFVASLALDLATLVLELVDRDDRLGLESGIDDHHVGADPDDDTGQDGASLDLLAGEALF